MARAVIFDVDGTIVDTVDLHAAAWAQAFAHFGHEVDEAEVRGQIGKGGDQLMPVFLPEDVLESRGEEISQYRTALFKRDYLPRARAFPRVRALFERVLGDGKRIAIGSSCKRDELEAYLRLADVEGLAEVTTTGDDAEHSKPCPDIFEAAFDKLQPIAREDVFVVGDSPFDAEAAVRAGLTPVGLLCGGFPERDLRAAGCVEIHDGPAALLEAYDRSILKR